MDNEGILAAKYNSLLGLIPQIVDNVWDGLVIGQGVVSIVIVPHKSVTTDFSIALQRELMEANIEFRAKSYGYIELYSSGGQIIISPCPDCMRGRGFSYLYAPIYSRTGEGAEQEKRESLELFKAVCSTYISATVDY